MGSFLHPTSFALSFILLLWMYLVTVRRQWRTRKSQQYPEGLQSCRLCVASKWALPKLQAALCSSLSRIERREQFRTGVVHTGLLFVSLCVFSPPQGDVIFFAVCEEKLALLEAAKCLRAGVQEVKATTCRWRSTPAWGTDEVDQLCGGKPFSCATGLV